MQCCSLPVLTYSIEIFQPTKTNMKKLEQFQKSLLKKVLSLPPNAPDLALYIITGLLHMEAQIDLKCLTLFHTLKLRCLGHCYCEALHSVACMRFSLLLWCFIQWSDYLFLFCLLIIDLKCLTLFHNICCQNRDSLEISIAIRQLQVNDENSNSWFIQLSRTLIQYGLKHPLELLEYPYECYWCFYQYY
jgi:hypothetical protein